MASPDGRGRAFSAPSRLLLGGKNDGTPFALRGRMAQNNDNLEVQVAPPTLRRTHAMHHDSEAASLALREQDAELVRQKAKRQHQQMLGYAVGRMLLSLVFLVSALVKMGRFSATQEALAEGGIADSAFVLSAGILIELVFGAALMVGFRTRIVAASLIAYLVCVTVLVLHDLGAGFNATFAINNVGFCGALLMLIGHGGGAWSIDRTIEHRIAQQSRG